MKTSIRLALSVLIISTFSSCKKTDTPNQDNYRNLEEVIIGCKSGDNFTAAIDPLEPNVLPFSDALCENMISGPSCLNGDKSFYYIVGSDKLVDEIEINTGEVRRSFQLSDFPIFMHNNANSNEIIFSEPIGHTHDYQLSKIDLDNGVVSQLFSFNSEYGFVMRSSFLRNGNLYFMNGMGELMKVNMSTKVCEKVIKLTGLSNILVYDAVLDKIFYLHSANMKNFSLYEYDFASNTDALLKNFMDITSILMSSNAYNPSKQNLYVYTTQNERTCINVLTLDKVSEPVDFALMNTEIVNCSIKQNNTQ